MKDREPVLTLNATGAINAEAVQKNVLYITYDGLSDPLGQSQVLPYVKGLAAQGYRFTILSFEKKDRYNREREVLEKLTKESNIDWVPLWFTSRPPLLSKFYDAIQMRNKAFELQREKRFDMVHCRSYVAANVGLQMKRKFGVKFLFDMRGFWADEKVDNGQWNLKRTAFRTLYRYYKKKEKDFLVSADGIVSLTHVAKDYLLKQKPFESLCIDVIPCCADLNHFNYESINQEEKKALRSKLAIANDSKVVTYLGSIGGWYMTREMFLFFKKLLEKDTRYVLLILTKDDVNRVQLEAKEFDIPLSNIRVTYSTRKELPVYLSLSNCSLFFIRNTFSKMASSPTKHAELMGMGIPVVCNNIGDTGRIIQDTNTGLLVDSFEPSDLASAVAQIDEIQKISKEEIRMAAMRFFDLEKGILKYKNLYHRIFSLARKQRDYV